MTSNSTQRPLAARLLWTLAIQSGGALAAMATLAVLGWAEGPKAQGLFSQTKADVEWLVALALLGMPQALFYFLHSRRLRAQHFSRWLLALLLLGALAAGAWLAWVPRAQGWPPLARAGMVAAVVLTVAHGLLRVSVLSRASTLAFNGVSAAPQVLVLLGVLAVFTLGRPPLSLNAVLGVWAAAMACASALALGVLVASAREAPALPSQATAPAPTATPASGPRFLPFASAAWLQASLAAGSAAWWLHHVEVHLGLAGVGLFALALVIVQAFLTPVNYAAPVLLRHWMDARHASAARGASASTPTANQATLRRAVSVAVPGSALLLLLAWAASHLLADRLSAAYAPLLGLEAWLALALGAELIIRIAAVDLLAQGRPWLPCLSEAIRASALLAVAITQPLLGLPMAVGAWAVAAAAGAAAVGVCLHIQGRCAAADEAQP